MSLSLMTSAASTLVLVQFFAAFGDNSSRRRWSFVILFEVSGPIRRS